MKHGQIYALLIDGKFMSTAEVQLAISKTSWLSTWRWVDPSSTSTCKIAILVLAVFFLDLACCYHKDGERLPRPSMAPPHDGETCKNMSKTHFLGLMCG